MKLFNLNIALKIDNDKEVVDLILKDKYDIVTLQESVRKLDEDVYHIFDTCGYICRTTKYKNNFFGPLWLGRQRRGDGSLAIDFGGYAEQGNQFLTNLPIVEAKNIFFYQDYAIYEDATNFRRDDHPRAFTDVIVKVGEKELQIINIHGAWSVDKKGNARTKLQTKAILKRVRHDIPSIVVGDVNLLPDTKEIKKMSKKMTNLIDKYNIQSTRPDFDDGLDVGNLVCDYIFVNDKVKVNDFIVMDTNVSDHLPLILDFDI